MNEHKDIDYPLLFAILSLVLFGSVMISSVSVYDSYRITREFVTSWTLEAPNNWRFVIRNLAQVVIGIVAFVVAIKIPFVWWKKYSKFLNIIALILLVAVLIPGLSVKINGSRGWFNIPGIPFSLQPTEFLKLSIIITVASFCAKYKAVLSQWSTGFLPFLFIIWLPSFLVFLQPDLWALFIIIPITFMMYFVAWGNMRFLGFFAIIGLLGVSTLYFLWSYDTVSERSQFSYIHDRIDAFLAPNKISIENGTMHHQNKQALIAIGSWWTIWLGFGNSIQKFGYLPEPQGDFIFSIITEELGFIWAMILIWVYIFIVYRWFLIMIACNDDFWKLTAFGITFWILWQMIVNISVNMSIFPNTGLTLPFVSYGWSSILSMLTAAGILLSISREKHNHFLPYLQSVFWRGRLSHFSQHLQKTSSIENQ